jgi:hypothetical protein
VTHDLDRYADLYHFSPDVNRWVVRAVCGRQFEVDAMTLAQRERELRAQVARAGTREELDAIVRHPTSH